MQDGYTTSGTLPAAETSNFYRVTLHQGETITITTTATTATLDPALLLIDSKGNVVAQIDASGVTDSISYPVAHSGIYYVDVTTSSDPGYQGGGGDYNLTIQLQGILQHSHDGMIGL